MANDVIGYVKCPWCASQKASVSVSKKGLCCVTCRACHAQTFARGAYADAMIRQSMRPKAAAMPTMPEPTPGMENAPKVQTAKKPAQKIERAPAAAQEAEPEVRQDDKPESSGWGLW